MATTTKRKSLSDRRLVGTEALAVYIDSTPGSIRQMIHKGKLPFPFSKHGAKLVFDLDKVDPWIDSLPEYGQVEMP